MLGFSDAVGEFCGRCFVELKEWIERSMVRLCVTFGVLAWHWQVKLQYPFELGNILSIFLLG